MQTTDTQPRPDRGWAFDCDIVADAIVCPPKVSGLVQPCGVVGPDGWVGRSATWRLGRALMEAPDQGPKVRRTLAGQHLWAGQLWVHFGHFLCESLSRLWAVERGEAESLVFIPKRPNKRMIKGFQRDLITMFGLTQDIRVIGRVTKVERLIVPGQGFGMGMIAAGTPEFRDFVHRRFARDIRPEGGPRLYVSRTGLKGPEGGVLLETAIEANMKAEGYEIFHPERHSLSEQIARYRAATHVVGLDGSAFHLFGFVARPDQQAAVILRRNTLVYRSIERQIAEFSGRAPVIVNCVSADWVPEGADRAGRNSFGELDIARVAQQLHEAGFISHPANWTIPKAAAVADAARQAGEGLGKHLTRRTGLQRRPGTMTPEEFEMAQGQLQDRLDLNDAA